MDSQTPRTTFCCKMNVQKKFKLKIPNLSKMIAAPSGGQSLKKIICSQLSNVHRYQNYDHIKLIQAHWRGKLQRMRYIKRRNESRKKNTRFLIQDLYETINKRQVVDFYLLFDANECELASQLVKRSHRYRTSGSTYEG